MRRPEGAYLALLAAAAAVVVVWSGAPSSQQQQQQQDQAGDAFAPAAYGPSNIRPVDLSRVEQHASSKQDRVTDFSDVRTQVDPALIDPHLHGFHEILDQVLSRVLNVPTNEELGARTEFAQYALSDTSNDHLIRASTQELIVQAGFDYETHFVEAADGYITELVRLVNPLADRAKLKRPPVAMFHGILADNSLWVTSSTLQHHPERWPRDPVEDGPMTSWNRSLGFVLANNGYDVWLVGTRGSNRFSQGHKRIKKRWSLYEDNVTIADVVSALEYWSNSALDDISANEVPKQLDLIMQLTGSPKLSVISFSASTLTTLGLLAERPEYAKHFHNYVIAAPVLSDRNTNNFGKLLYQLIMQLDYFDGTLLLPETACSQQFRDAVFLLAESRTLRYTLIKDWMNIMMGSSPTYNTLWEKNVFTHTFWPTGFKEFKHLCQILTSGKFHKFDYGPIENHLRYGSFQAPDYDLSKVTPGDNWLILSSANDPFSTRDDVRRFIRAVGKQPYRHVYLPENNHYDNIYAVDCDIRTSLPILEFLDRFPYEPAGGDGPRKAVAAEAHRRNFRQPPLAFANGTDEGPEDQLRHP